MSPGDIATLVNAIFGAGGLGGIILWALKRRGKTVPEMVAKRVEAKAVAESEGVTVEPEIVQQWRDYSDHLQQQNEQLAEQNRLLWEQNRQLLDQNSILRSQAVQSSTVLAQEARQRVLALDYVDDLIKHIRQSRPAPPPPWPDGLERPL